MGWFFLYQMKEDLLCELLVLISIFVGSIEVLVYVVFGNEFWIVVK